MNYSEFELLWALIVEAERYTTRWDSAIDEIELELARDGHVGLSMNQVAS